MRKRRRQREFRPQSPTDGVTETTIGLAARPLHATDAAVVHPDGGVDHLRDEAHLPDENVTAAKAHVATAPERGVTAQSPQGITEATGTAVTPNPQRGVQKRATRRVEEETCDPRCILFSWIVPFSDLDINVDTFVHLCMESLVFCFRKSLHFKIFSDHVAERINLNFFSKICSSYETVHNPMHQ